MTKGAGCQPFLDDAPDLVVQGWPRVGHRRRRLEPLAVTSWALMANTVTTSAMGMVFWAVASRIYSPQALGESAALVSAMVLLSTVSQLNLGIGIPRLLPQVQDRRWRPVLGAYGLTAVVGAVLTGGFLALVPQLPDGFAFLAHDKPLGMALVAAVVLWNIFALQDAVLTSARWAPAVPVENGLFGLLKIVLMIWLGGGLLDHGVFFAWLLAMALLLLPVNGLIFGRVLPSRSGRHEPGVKTVLSLSEPRRVTRYLATDYLASLLSQGSTALLPLLVIGVLGRAENAYFYVAFLITAAVGALGHSLSTSLVAEGGHDERELRSLVTRSVMRYARYVAPVVVMAIVAAPLLLAPFGEEYVTHGTTLLRLLLAGTLLQAVVSIYLGMERIRAKVSRVLGVEAITVVLVIAGALVGMRWHGLAGLGQAWLVAQVIVAGLVAPRLWHAVRATGVAPATAMASVAALTDHRRRPASPAPERPRPAPFPATGDFIDVGAALLTATLLLVAGLGVAGTPRVILALVFVTFVPGWALLNHVRMPVGPARIALAVALSLSLGIVATVLSLWLGLWHPRGLFAVAAVTCLFALLWHLARGDGPAVAPVVDALGRVAP